MNPNLCLFHKAAFEKTKYYKNGTIMHTEELLKEIVNIFSSLI